MSKKRKWSGSAKRSVKRYNSYVKEFKKRSTAMKERGLKPYEEKQLTYKEYRTIYAAEKNDRLAEIKKGERKTLGDINSKIVSDQIYELSEKQAYAIYDYIKVRRAELTEQYQNILDDEGNRVYSDKQIKALVRQDLGNFSLQNANRAIQKIREGSYVRENLGLWDAIRERRKELFDQGFKKDEVRNIVSNEFFYPEEESEE